MSESVAMSVSVPSLVRDAMPTLPPGVSLAPGDDLRAAGLTSTGSVILMLAIESAFDIAIPDAELTPANFRSIAAIEALVLRLKAA
jgi:acyl carrier protein